MSRVLVVDDEEGIREGVRDALVREGHDVVTAKDGEEALSLFAKERFDLLITDLSMPRQDGLDLVRALRESSEVPVLVLTVRGEEREKVRLLDAGADDYVVKPFGLAELLARTRSLLRRRGVTAAMGETFQIGGLAVDLSARRVTRDGREIHLTPTEFALLKTFLGKPGVVFTHRQLISTVWEGSGGVTNDALRVQVGSLRKKIEENPDRPRVIRTEPWVGYRLLIDG
ncbi:MAG TPA: response regulator transcription factor [Thermoanaerobaculia bacterium]|nr:response regulator transcription factor [Thermoanaerobaculia bacterium]